MISLVLDPKSAFCLFYSLHGNGKMTSPRGPSGSRVRMNVKHSWGNFFLKLCHSVPVDTRKHLKTSSQQKKQEKLLVICKRIVQLGGELPINWLDCEVIYLERFVQKLQRKLDRQVIGF